ncbi:MAG TPA: ABC transporter permease [Thermoanaerobaculia bacterium]|jgi:ABC-2 type transport system permease protein|nr:ABC transporter permease [Thermoanaerobaculia bacterium]
MRLDYAVIIGKREYLARIRTKGFWIATVAVPAFIGALVLGPSLLMSKTSTEQRLAIVDATGTGLGRELKAALEAGEPAAATPGAQPGAMNTGGEHGANVTGAQPDTKTAPGEPGARTGGAAGGGRRGGAGHVHFSVRLLVQEPGRTAAGHRELDAMAQRREIGAWIRLDRDGLAANRFEYHAESLSNVITQEALERRVSEVVGRWRLRQAGLDAAKIDALVHPLAVQTVRISATGSRAEGGAAGFFLAFVLFFMLYMGILIYGNQVMQGVLEEKGSRIIEVLSAAVKPTELMLGKLGGICLVALTQMAIWAAALAVLTAPGLLAAMVAMPPELALPVLHPALWLNFFLLFLCGFFLFATFYAMLGAAFNSLQEAQQLAGLPAIFVVAPAVFMVQIINDPDSALSVGLSLVPPLTPLVMMLRIATRMPPLWQLLAAYGLCAAAIAVMIWVCARVYRVGILMYGKKPTLQEIWRWVRHA